MISALSIKMFVMQYLSVFLLSRVVPILAQKVNVTKVAGSTPVGTPISFTCTFDSQWTAATHPIDYPSNAHWSPMFMASRNKDYSMWDSGAKATAGVQSVAETGSLSTLRSEVAQAGDSIGSSTSVSGALFLSNDSTTDFTESLEMDEDHSLITSISMIAPSPDWFTGFYDFSPVEDGMWLSSFSIETYAWDAGTDSGITYSSSNQATSPKDNIFQLTPESLPSSKVFLSPDELTVEPVARWSCIMKKEVNNAEEFYSRTKICIMSIFVSLFMLS